MKKKVIALGLAVMMAIGSTMTVMAQQDVYEGQQTTVSTKTIYNVYSDGEIEYTDDYTISLKTGGWDDYWNKIDNLTKEASIETITPLTDSDYQWISYFCDVQQTRTYTKIPPSAAAVYNSEPIKMPSPSFITDAKLIIDGVEFNQDLITSDVLYMNTWKKGSLFTLTIDGVVYDKCFSTYRLFGSNDGLYLLQLPKAVKSVTLEYIPYDRYDNAMTVVNRPEDKVVIHIMGGQSQTQASVQTWKSDSKGWWVENPDGSYLKNEWYNDNDKWYYLGSDGYMLTNTTTPDGYTVNADGVRVE